jgi:uncharacterized protein YbbC (DUF1343 family)
MADAHSDAKQAHLHNENPSEELRIIMMLRRKREEGNFDLSGLRFNLFVDFSITCLTRRFLVRQRIFMFQFTHVLFMICLLAAIVPDAKGADYSKSDSALHAQLDKLAEMAKGKRLALLTNGAAHDSTGLQDVDYLLRQPGTTITAFFGPEHGFRGTLADGAHTGDYIDPATSIPVFSLYGKRVAPTDEQMKNIDILAFDIPDVGVRFYTYSWTMTYAMEACARNGKTYVIIDRPNPITGNHVEGAVNTQDYNLVGRLGTGKFGDATRHGMTIGELASYWNGERMSPKADLKVIKAEGWKRSQWWDQTGRPFIPPSPNMRTLAAATVYPGTCIFEGTNLSEGRGTSTPFEMMGAPFVDGAKWADALNARHLAGVTFKPVKFTPDSRRWAHEDCGGVQIVVTDREKFEPVRTGIHMLQTVKKLYPEQVKITDYAGRLMAVPGLEKLITEKDVEAIVKAWQPGLDEFKKVRSKYLLYPE